MSDADKATMTNLFAGQEALAAWLSVLTASEEDWEKLAGKIDNAAGSAEKMSKIKMDTLKGDLDGLSSAWESIQLTIMGGEDNQGSSGLRSFIQGVTEDLRMLDTLMKDGLTFGDIGKFGAKIFKQLKDEALAFDGVGSLLAGGALVYGLKKIFDLAVKAKNAFKELRTAATMGAAGTGGGATPSPSTSVAGMSVKANSVTVYGRSVAQVGAGQRGTPQQGLPAPTGRRVPSTGTPPTTGAPSVGRWGNALKMGGGAAAFSAILGAVDVFATKNYTDEQTASADWSANEAKKTWQAANDWLYEISQDTSATAQDRQDAEQALADATKNLTEAQKYQKDTAKENATAMAHSVGGAVGGTVGTAIGGALGTFVGPVGTVIGATVGGIIGQQIGSWIGGESQDGGLFDMQGRIEREKQYAEDVKKEKAAYEGSAEERRREAAHRNAHALKGIVTPTENITLGNPNSPYKSVKEHNLDRDVSDEEMRLKEVQAKREKFFDDLTEFFTFHPEKFSDTTFNLDKANENAAMMAQNETAAPLVPSMENVSLSSMLGIDWENEYAYITGQVSSIFSGIGESLSGAWESIGQGATTAKDVITNEFTFAYNTVTETYGQASAWFETTVYTPITTAAITTGSGIAEGVNTGIGIIKSAWEGLKSWFSDLFSSISAKASNFAASVSSFVHGDVGHNATGTSRWGGGLTEINEHGGEIVDLPSGARIYPHATTMNMLAKEFGGYAPQMTDPLQTFAATFKANNTENGNTDSEQAQPTSVNITGNTFTVREDADIDRIAYALFNLMRQASGNYQYTGA